MLKSLFAARLEISLQPGLYYSEEQDGERGGKVEHQLEVT